MMFMCNNSDRLAYRVYLHFRIKIPVFRCTYFRSNSAFAHVQKQPPEVFYTKIFAKFLGTPF